MSADSPLLLAALCEAQETAAEFANSPCTLCNAFHSINKHTCMRWKARTPVLQSQTVWRGESIVYRSTASSCRQLNCQAGARTGRRWGRQPPGWGRLRRCRCRLARPGRTHRRRWPPLLRWQGTPRYARLPPAPKATNTHCIQAAETESCPLYLFI